MRASIHAFILYPVVLLPIVCINEWTELQCEETRETEKLRENREKKDIRGAYYSCVVTMFGSCNVRSTCAIEGDRIDRTVNQYEYTRVHRCCKTLTGRHFHAAKIKVIKKCAAQQFSNKYTCNIPIVKRDIILNIICYAIEKWIIAIEKWIIRE